MFQLTITLKPIRQIFPNFRSLPPLLSLFIPVRFFSQPLADYSVWGSPRHLLNVNFICVILAVRCTKIRLAAALPYA